MEQKPDPMKYIERRLEHKPSQAIVELALKKLETPLKKVQYKKEGTIKIITEEFRLEFSYRQVSPESDLNNMIKMDYEAFYNAIMIQSQLTQWRVLTDFRITDKSGNVVFDIKKELPGYIIFFHIIDKKQNQDKEQKQSSANPEARILLSEEILVHQRRFLLYFMKPAIVKNMKSQMNLKRELLTVITKN
jgi:hypothetical protein